VVKKIYTICLIIIFTIMLSGCAVFKESPKNRIERLYDIELPQKMDVIYSHVGETFTGEAEQYTVFKLK